MYSVKDIVDLPLDLKVDVLKSYTKDEDDIIILDALANSISLNLPMTDNLKDLVQKKDSELKEDLRVRNITDPNTRGEAIDAILRYDLCSNKMKGSTLRVITSQTFEIDGSKLDCSSEIGRMFSYNSEVVLPENVMNTDDFKNYIKIHDLSPQTSFFRKSTVEGSPRVSISRSSVKIRPSLDDLLNNLSEQTFDSSEDFLQAYNNSIEKEDKMRMEMYMPKTEHLYKDNLYNLYELHHNVVPKNQEWKEEIYHTLLFQSSDLVVVEDQGTRLSKKFLDEILKGVEDKVMIAGGSVFAQMYRSAYNDYDLFIIDSTPEEAEKIVNKIHKNLKCKVIYRSKNVITFKNEDYDVQIILRLYKTVSEVLHGFDVDSCCVGYYKGKFYATERAIFSLYYSTNTVNFNRLSPSYEYRLVKYAKRGLSIFVPDLDKSLIDRELLDVKMDRRRKIDTYDLEGLSILIYYENLHNKYERSIYSNLIRSANRTIDYMDIIEISDYDYFGKYSGSSLLSIFKSLKPRPAWDKQRFIMNVTDPNIVISDVVYTTQKIIRFLRTDDGKIGNVLHFKDIKFINMLSDYLQDRDDEQEEFQGQDQDSEEDYREEREDAITWDVPVDVEWKMTNPGEQMTNTFHKIVLKNNEAWYEGKYYHY